MYIDARVGYSPTSPSFFLSVMRTLWNIHIGDYRLIFDYYFNLSLIIPAIALFLQRKTIRAKLAFYLIGIFVSFGVMQTLVFLSNIPLFKISHASTYSPSIQQSIIILCYHFFVSSIAIYALIKFFKKYVGVVANN